MKVSEERPGVLQFGLLHWNFWVWGVGERWVRPGLSGDCTGEREKATTEIALFPKTAGFRESRAGIYQKLRGNEQRGGGYDFCPFTKQSWGHC